MKPWEEIWTAERYDLVDQAGKLIAGFLGRFPNHEPAQLAQDEARAKLAAQAPAMARVLLDALGRERNLIQAMGPGIRPEGSPMERILRDAGVIE